MSKQIRRLMLSVSDVDQCLPIELGLNVSGQFVTKIEGVDIT
jgi:hypothetical protein